MSEMSKRDPNGSEALTRGVRVHVASQYEESQSRPADGYYFFSYTIRIANEGAKPVQLWSRRWVITDGDGNQQVVEGDGVVGHQPILGPGESFEYTSFCPLPTQVGAMEGSYRMLFEDGGEFEAEVAPFTLALPAAVN